MPADWAMNPNLFIERPAAGIEAGSPNVGGAWPARRGGDFRSPRKPAGAAPGNSGLPLKARLPPPKKEND
jgi:hypothetical protein